jgi:hypothetical protein
VWGAGIAEDRDARFAQRVKNVTYAAVRGPRTWKVLHAGGIDCPRVFGDPAMLLPLYLSNDIRLAITLGLTPRDAFNDDDAA